MNALISGSFIIGIQKVLGCKTCFNNILEGLTGDDDDDDADDADGADDADDDNVDCRIAFIWPNLILMIITNLIQLIIFYTSAKIRRRKK